MTGVIEAVRIWMTEIVGISWQSSAIIGNPAISETAAITACTVPAAYNVACPQWPESCKQRM